MIGNLNIFLKTLKNSLRMFITLLFLNILELSLAQAQRITPYFSTISEIPLFRGNQNLLIGDFNGDGSQDICSYGNGIINIIYNPDNLDKINIKYIQIESKNILASVDDINSDDISDIVYLDSKAKILRSYLGSKQDTIISKWKFKLDDSYTKITIADINNDNRKDIILYGKKNLGLTILLGNGDGTFRYPRNILQDYFLSEVLICNCSEDDIADIFAINWIDNTILYFASYAPMKYLSPAIISFDSEPVSFQTFYLNDDDFIDLAVLIEDQQTIITFLGDNLGNYIFKDKLSLPYRIDKFFVSNGNQLSNNNLIIFNKQNNIFALLVKDNIFRYKEELVYSTSTVASDFVIYQLTNSDIFNIVITSEINKKLYLLQHAQIHIMTSTQQKYLTMPLPQNLFSFDLNNDGNSDFILSSSGNYNNGLYFNTTEGKFTGMINLKEFPKNINNIHFIPNANNGFLAITTHNAIPSVNLVFLNVNDYTSSYYPLTGIPNPEIQYVKTKNDGGIECFLSSYNDDSKFFDLYYYTQFGKYKFSEKIINTLGNNISGITMIDLNGDNYPDYLYLKRYFKKNLALISSILDSNYNIIKNKKHFEIQDTTEAKYFFFKQDLNNDNHQDLLLFSPDKMELSISLFNPVDSVFKRPHQKIENVKLNSLNNIQFADFDINENIDLVIGNIYTQTLQVYFNIGNAQFSNFETIMGIYEINSFLVKDLNNDSLTDIALVYKDGFLKIVYGQK